MCEEERKVEILQNNTELIDVKVDVEKCKMLEKQLNGILNGVPDVIKVYNADYTIAFFNEAGYKFYNTNLEEVKDKKCYEILGRTEKCLDCSFEAAVQTKDMISKERYIPELNKFMDVSCNAVIGENGEPLYIVERLRDITEKRILQKVLEEREETYKQAIKSIPDPVIIIVDNIIVLGNLEASKLFNLSYDQLIGSNIYKHFQEKYLKPLHKRYRKILLHKKTKDISEYEFILSDNRVAILQISHSYISYKGKPAIIAIIRDVTEIKKELNKAAEIQRKTIQKEFPAEGIVDIKTVYVPADIVSGDFYRIYKVSETLIVGILVDVRGKGISAALSISAFDVLCFQEIAVANEPMEIVKNLNKKLIDYYEENYIAVCCFSIDFSKKQLKVVGAGINQFIFQREKAEEKIVEGTFLGMFENSEFAQQIISLQKGDRIYFFTDGLDFILDEDKVIQTYMEDASALGFKNYIEEFLNDTILDVGKLKDDSTMILIEVL